MDRNELTLVIAGTLLAAFLLGWIMRWFFSRLNATGPRNARRARDMAAQLHAAEDARHAAEQALADHTKAQSRRVSELQADLDAARDALARAEAEAERMGAAYHEAVAGRVPR